MDLIFWTMFSHTRKFIKPAAKAINRGIFRGRVETHTRSGYDTQAPDHWCARSRASYNRHFCISWEEYSQTTLDQNVSLLQGLSEMVLCPLRYKASSRNNLFSGYRACWEYDNWWPHWGKYPILRASLSWWLKSVVTKAPRAFHLSPIWRRWFQMNLRLPRVWVSMH